MAQSIYPQSNPAILLLNEIDILLAQARLMELYLKQAQASGAAEATRVNQQHQAELAVLRASLAEKDLAALKQNERIAEQQQLVDRIEEVEGQLNDKQRLLDNREREVEAHRSEAATLRGQIADLEIASERAQMAVGEATAQNQNLQNELAALRQQIEKGQQDFQQQRLIAQEVEQGLHGQLAQLQTLLINKQIASQHAASELDHARSEIATLHQRISKLQESGQQAEANAAAELEQSRGRFEAEIASLQTMLAAREQAEQKSSATLAEIEQNLKGEILTLRSALEQKHQQIESRDRERRQAELELAARQQRIAELEDAHRRALAEKSELAAELDKALRAHENEIARVRYEAGVKKSELTQAYDAATNSERVLHKEIHGLKEELSRSHNDLADRQSELERAGAEIAALREQDREREKVRQEAEENWQRSGIIQSELLARLQAKTDELSAAHASANDLRKELNTKIEELQLELAQKQLLAESRSVEIGDLKANASHLSDQLARLESAQRETTDALQHHEESGVAQQQEIAALREGFQVKYQALESELARERDSANSARSQHEQSAHRVVELETELNEHRQHLHAAGAETAALNARLRELAIQQERSQTAADEMHRLANTAQAELVTLQQELQQKTWALAQQQAMVEELASAHKAQIQNLNAKLDEHTSVRDGRLEKSEARALSLQRRVEELETELRHAELTAVARAEQISQAHSARIEELTAALGEKTAELQERGAAYANLSQSLRHETDRLLREVQERNEILQNRNDELVRVKAELDATHECLAQLESAASQAEAATRGEVESIQSEFQAQLALLQAELSQKEWALEERQAAAAGLEQDYLQEIESLRQQLAEKKADDDRRSGDLLSGEGQFTAAQQQRLAMLEEMLHGAEKGAVNFRLRSNHRRWGGGFAAKRRWKTSTSEITEATMVRKGKS